MISPVHPVRGKIKNVHTGESTYFLDFDNMIFMTGCFDLSGGIKRTITGVLLNSYLMLSSCILVKLVFTETLRNLTSHDTALHGFHLPAIRRFHTFEA